MEVHSHTLPIICRNPVRLGLSRFGLTAGPAHAQGPTKGYVATLTAKLDAPKRSVVNGVVLQALPYRDAERLGFRLHGERQWRYQ